MKIDSTRVEDLCQKRRIRLLVLFGSRSGGAARPGSDIDLAVLLDRDPGLGELLALQRDIEAALELEQRLDLVVLNTLNSTTLGREIARNGKAIFDRSGEEFTAFKIRAMKEYADFEPFRRLRREVLAKGGRR